MDILEELKEYGDTLRKMREMGLLEVEELEVLRRVGVLR